MTSVGKTATANLSGVMEAPGGTQPPPNLSRAHSSSLQDKGTRVTTEQRHAETHEDWLDMDEHEDEDDSNLGGDDTDGQEQGAENLQHNDNDVSILRIERQSLPLGWSVHLSDLGVPYFHNEELQSTSWERPGTDSAAAVDEEHAAVANHVSKVQHSSVEDVGLLPPLWRYGEAKGRMVSCVILCVVTICCLLVLDALLKASWQNPLEAGQPWVLDHIWMRRGPCVSLLDASGSRSTAMPCAVSYSGGLVAIIVLLVAVASLLGRGRAARLVDPFSKALPKEHNGSHRRLLLSYLSPFGAMLSVVFVLSLMELLLVGLVDISPSEAGASSKHVVLGHCVLLTETDVDMPLVSHVCPFVLPPSSSAGVFRAPPPTGATGSFSSFSNVLPLQGAGDDTFATAHGASALSSLLAELTESQMDGVFSWSSFLGVLVPILPTLFGLGPWEPNVEACTQAAVNLLCEGLFPHCNEDCEVHGVADAVEFVQRECKMKQLPELNERFRNGDHLKLDQIQSFVDFTLPQLNLVFSLLGSAMLNISSTSSYTLVSGCGSIKDVWMPITAYGVNLSVTSVDPYSQVCGSQSNECVFPAHSRMSSVSLGRGSSNSNSSLRGQCDPSRYKAPADNRNAMFTARLAMCCLGTVCMSAIIVFTRPASPVLRPTDVSFIMWKYLLVPDVLVVSLCLLLLYLALFITLGTTEVWFSVFFTMLGLAACHLSLQWPCAFEDILQEGREKDKARLKEQEQANVEAVSRAKGTSSMEQLWPASTHSLANIQEQDQDKQEQVPEDRWCSCCPKFYSFSGILFVYSELRLIVVQAQHWYSHVFGYESGKWYELKAAVLEVVEVVVQCIGLDQLARNSDAPTMIPVVVILWLNIIVSPFVWFLLHPTKRRKTVLLFDIAMDICYMTVNLSAEVNPLLLLTLGLPFIMSITRATSMCSVLVKKRALAVLPWPGQLPNHTDRREQGCRRRQRGHYQDSRTQQGNKQTTKRPYTIEMSAPSTFDRPVCTKHGKAGTGTAIGAGAGAEDGAKKDSLQKSNSFEHPDPVVDIPLETFVSHKQYSRVVGRRQSIWTSLNVASQGNHHANKSTQSGSSNRHISEKTQTLMGSVFISAFVTGLFVWFLVSYTAQMQQCDDEMGFWSGARPRIIFPRGITRDTDCAWDRVEHLDAALQTGGTVPVPVSQLMSRVAQMTRLRSLDIRGHQGLTSLAPVFALTDLLHINARDTDLQELRLPLSGLPALQTLEVSFTQLSFVSPSLFLKPQLRGVNVASSPFAQSVPWGAGALVADGLSEAQQTALLSPNSLFGLSVLTRLHTLDVSGNALTALPDLMSQYVHLHSINASHNRLSHLANLDLTNPRVLDFSHNMLSSDSRPGASILDYSVVDVWSNHTVLNIEHNNLDYLPAGVIDFPGQLFALIGNPLRNAITVKSECSIWGIDECLARGLVPDFDGGLVLVRRFPRALSQLASVPFLRIKTVPGFVAQIPTSLAQPMRELKAVTFEGFTGNLSGDFIGPQLTAIVRAHCHGIDVVDPTRDTAVDSAPYLPANTFNASSLTYLKYYACRWPRDFLGYTLPNLTRVELDSPQTGHPVHKPPWEWASADTLEELELNNVLCNKNLIGPETAANWTRLRSLWRLDLSCYESYANSRDTVSHIMGLPKLRRLHVSFVYSLPDVDMSQSALYSLHLFYVGVVHDNLLKANLTELSIVGDNGDNNRTSFNLSSIFTQEYCSRLLHLKLNSLSYSVTRELPLALANFTRLLTLSWRYNDLHSIPPNIFSTLHELRVVKLEGNPNLQALPDELAQLPHLQTVSIPCHVTLPAALSRRVLQCQAIFSGQECSIAPIT